MEQAAAQIEAKEHSSGRYLIKEEMGEMGGKGETESKEKRGFLSLSRNTHGDERGSTHLSLFAIISGTVQELSPGSDIAGTHFGMFAVVFCPI